MAEIKETSKNVGDLVISRVEQLSKAGLRLPKDFDATTAIKMSMLKLAEIKDKNGKSVTEACTSTSIQSALFKMCCYGMNLAMGQCYAIIRGTTLCIDPSYFGKVLMVKRIFPEWEPYPQVIRQDDKFEYGTDAATGRKYLVCHEQKLENIDKDFIGGYIVLPTKDGKGTLYIMTAKQIKTAWAKSSSREMNVHRSFDEKMIGKTLINSGCNMIINSTPDYQMMEENEDITRSDSDATRQIEPEYATFEEVQDEVPADKPKEVAYKEQADAPKRPVGRPKANPEPTPEPAPADPPIQENKEDDEF